MLMEVVLAQEAYHLWKEARGVEGEAIGKDFRARGRLECFQQHNSIYHPKVKIQEREVLHL